MSDQEDGRCNVLDCPQNDCVGHCLLERESSRCFHHEFKNRKKD